MVDLLRGEEFDNGNVCESQGLQHLEQYIILTEQEFTEPCTVAKRTRHTCTRHKPVSVKRCEEFLCGA
jgi:hypothetical protein